MSDTISPARPRARLSLQMMLVLVGLFAGVLGVGRYLWLYTNADRAMASVQFRALSDRDPLRRITAIDVLSQGRGTEYRPVLPALTATLVRDEDPAVRAAAAAAIERVIEREAPSGKGLDPAEVQAAVSALARSLDDPDPAVRVEAARSLGWMTSLRGIIFAAGLEPDPQPIVSALVETIADPEPSVRAEAIESLAWLVPPEADVPTAIVDAIDDPVEAPRVAAARFLLGGRAAATEFLPRVVARLDTAGPFESASLLSAIEWTRGQLPPPAYAPLLARLDRAEPEERQPLVRALLCVRGPVPPSALPVLQRVLRDEIGLDEGGAEGTVVVANLCYLLADLGPAARPVGPDLMPLATRFLDGKGGDGFALHTIVAIDPESAEAQALLPLLVARLQTSKRREDRPDEPNMDPYHEELIRVLRLYGPAAGAARDDLRLMRMDGDPGLAPVAGELLELIESADKKVMP